MTRILQITKTSLIAILVLCTGTFVYSQEYGGVKGQVRTFQGDGIPKVRVTARMSGKNVKSVYSDDKGKFVLDGLRSGTYNFVFSREGFVSGLKAEVEVKDGTIRDLGDDLLLDVDRGTQVIVNGSVFSSDGFTVPGAKIRIEKQVGGGKFKKLGVGVTNRQGEFVFRLPEETVTLRITASARGKKDVKELEVSEAAIYRLALNLDFKRKP